MHGGGAAPPPARPGAPRAAARATRGRRGLPREQHARSRSAVCADSAGGPGPPTTPVPGPERGPARRQATARRRRAGPAASARPPSGQHEQAALPARQDPGRPARPGPRRVPRRAARRRARGSMRSLHDRPPWDPRREGLAPAGLDLQSVEADRPTDGPPSARSAASPAPAPGRRGRRTVGSDATARIGARASHVWSAATRARPTRPSPPPIGSARGRRPRRRAPLRRRAARQRSSRRHDVATPGRSAATDARPAARYSKSFSGEK